MKRRNPAGEDLVLYHVTTDKKLKKILKDGIKPMRKPGPASLGQIGQDIRQFKNAIYAFENPQDAARWAFKLSWSGKGPKAYIVQFSSNAPWFEDTHFEAQLSSAMGGNRWLVSYSKVPAKNIMAVSDFDPSLIRVDHETQSIDYLGEPLNGWIQGYSQGGGIQMNPVGSWDIDGIAKFAFEQLQGFVRSGQSRDIHEAWSNFGEDVLTNEVFWTVYSREPSRAKRVTQLVRDKMESMLEVMPNLRYRPSARAVARNRGRGDGVRWADKKYLLDINANMIFPTPEVEAQFNAAKGVDIVHFNLWLDDTIVVTGTSPGPVQYRFYPNRRYPAPYLVMAGPDDNWECVRPRDLSLYPASSPAELHEAQLHLDEGRGYGGKAWGSYKYDSRVPPVGAYTHMRNKIPMEIGPDGRPRRRRQRPKMKLYTFSLEQFLEMISGKLPKKKGKKPPGQNPSKDFPIAGRYESLSELLNLMYDVRRSHLVDHVFSLPDGRIMYPHELLEEYHPRMHHEPVFYDRDLGHIYYFRPDGSLEQKAAFFVSEEH